MLWTITEFDKKYSRSDFDCGLPKLNEYIKTYISQDLRRGLTRAYVAIDPESTKIVGYYTLSSAQVGCHEVPDKWKKKVGVYPVPCSLIGRLAVDRTMQGKGLGEFLLMEAMRRTARLSEEVGIYAMDVFAISERAKAFYVRYGFVELMDEERHLYMHIKTVREAARLMG